MSFFYRSRSARIVERSPAMMRLATTIALAGYPAGGLVMILSPDPGQPGAAWGEAAGLVLIAISLIAFATFAASRLQRIAGEEKGKLDEFELELRLKARAFAYNLFSTIVLVGVVYLGIAMDLRVSERAELWIPADFDDWSGILWGLILYAFVLPTAYLAWTLPAPPVDDA